MTHADLVQRAVRWLRNGATIRNQWGDDRSRRVCCGVVFSELVTSTWETPDAIGWGDCGMTSILVECKVSRSDFARDKKKPSRHYQQFGVGKYRYYLAPSGLLRAEEMPERWGLLEFDGKRVSVSRLAEEIERNMGYEMRMMYSALRRKPEALK